MNTTTNPKQPPRRMLLAAMGVLLAVLLLGAGGFMWLAGGGTGGNAVGIGGPFTLEDGSGKPVTDRDFRGKYMLVYFGYTFCPDVCPTTLSAVADAMDKLGPDAARIRPLFITVDPRRDTPPVVKKFAAAFGPEITGLTGTPEQIARVAKEYRVYYAEHRTGPGPDDYSMDHSSVLYLMDPKGAFLAPVRADETGDEIAASLRKLMG
nr:SCO family protein [uncultured Rhodopila sp.]